MMVTVGPFPSQLLWNIDAAQPSVLACQHLTKLLLLGLLRTGYKYNFSWSRYLLSSLLRMVDTARPSKEFFKIIIITLKEQEKAKSSKDWA